MIKFFCDKCGKEMNHRGHTIDIPCHVVESGGSLHGYVDTEGNAVSGRVVSFDLCNRCTNDVFVAAFNVIQDGPQKENTVAGDRAHIRKNKKR